MKRITTTVLVTAAILVILFWIAGLAGANPLARPGLSAGAPSVVSYQGQVSVSGTPFDGTGYFKFAIVDAAGTSTYWSNDNTSAGGSEPTGGVPLPVSDGQFDVLLGDTTLTNMTQALDASVFEGVERYLRVWFSDNGSTYQQLSPDRRIAAVPYALQAEKAANGVPVGAMVLAETNSETALINAGFSYTGLTVQPASWSTKSPMPTGRAGPAAAVVDGVLYVIGGENYEGYLSVNEAYDPDTNTWSTKAPMPTARAFLAAAAVDGVIYVIGGETSETLWITSTVEAYNPATDSWSTMAPMPTARENLAAATVDGIIYAIGGYDDSFSTVATTEAYDPDTNSWSTKAPMPAARRSLTAAAVDGVIYVIGGMSSGGRYLAVNEAYDPATNTWNTKASMPVGRMNLAAVAMDGVIYAIGGYSSQYLALNHAYNPASNTWTTEVSMPTTRDHLAAAAVDGVVYIIGGNLEGNLAVNEAFAPTPSLYVYRKH